MKKRDKNTYHFARDPEAAKKYGKKGGQRSTNNVFFDTEKAREAQKKSVEARKRNKERKSIDIA